MAEAAQAVETPQPQPVVIVEAPPPPRNDDEVAQGIAAMLDREQSPETTAPETPANVQANPESAEDGATEGADGEPSDTEAREAEGETPEADGQDGETSSEDAVEVANTFEGLADQLGVDEAAFSEHMQIPVKIDGQTKAVSLAELRAGYQLESKYRSNSTALAEERRTFEAERDGFQNERQQNAQLFQAMAAHAEQLIVGQEQAIDPSLEHTDPEQFLMQKNAARERREQLQMLYGGLNQTTQQMAQQTQASQAAYVNQQAARLAELVPEWGADPDKGRKEIGELRTWAADRYGYERAEVDQMFDARTIKVFADLRRLTDLEKKVPTMAKKLKALPKAVKPGAARDRGDAQRERTAKSLNKLGQTGHTDDFAEMLLASGIA